MKKLLLFTAISALPALVVAQTEKGQGIWTGSAAFNFVSTKTDQGQANSFYRMPQSRLSFSRGVFFKDNWLAGGGVSLGWQAAKYGVTIQNQSSDNHLSNLNAGLDGFVRRYWGKDKWRVFLGGGLTLGYESARYTGESVNSNPDQDHFTIAPVFQAEPIIT
ncbi:hypothetical protein [Larkinella terrae]|uniref:Outer membrane beta-barrel protein n=1 Tax=Larkinella terrae TaxID=2025311 RepID=A0A7K0EM78_9BACT|nr:hypothetical protein [Larkinella terrae]MRS62963.1 hypothetical protein [Larkinella terrae]